MKTMRAYLFVFVLLGTLAARDQDATPAAPTATVSGVTVDGLVYPTNSTTIDTPKAGILGLRAIDIPRYTQTGPLPNLAPERHWVLPPVPHNPKLPTIWTIGDSTVRCGVNASGDDMPGQWGWGTPFVGYFDPNKANVVNRAVGGTTSASFYADLWKGMVDLIKKGDVVIMQFGTNSGRGELPGIGEETQQAIGRDGQAVTNHTYGWYLRKFIAETRAKGATPVVCSLIPRGSRSAMRGTVPQQAVWARDVAIAESADFIDLHELVSRRYDMMDVSAVNALFSGSPHTNWAGAVVNAETVISGLKALKPNPVEAYYMPQVKEISAAPDLSQPVPAPATQPASQPATPPAMASGTGRGPVADSPRDQFPFSNTNLTNVKPDVPTLFICGDSTAANGNSRQRGWGALLIDYFDTSKVNLVNYSQGGINFPAYYGSRWPQVVAALKPGDFVVVELGHNGGHLPGTGDETAPIRGGGAGETHTFGWYIRTFIRDARAKGATMIVSTTTTRYLWTNPNAQFNAENGSLISKNDNYNPAADRVERGMGDVMPDGRRTMLVWAEQVAKEEKAPFVDHSSITADLYEKTGREVVGKYHSDRTHTYTEGAIVNAETFIAGLKALPDMPLVNLLNDKGKAIPAYKPAGTSGPQPAPGAAQPPPATRAVPRGTQGPEPQSVSPRDSEPFTPDNFTSLKPNLPTLIIAGDSTADKGPDAQHRGWAAVLIDYFDTNKINVVNRARGGRSCRSLVREGLWDELVAAVKPGDFVMIQFGHNDGGDVNNPNGRPDLPGTSDDTQTVQRPDGTSEAVHTFGWYNRKFIKDVRNKGGTAVLVAATPYNRWTNGKFVHQPGDLSEWARQVADQEKVLFLNHTDIVGARYDQLGEEAVRPFFPADFLHTSTPGAIVNAEMFIAGMKALDIKPLIDMLNDKGRAISAYKPAAGAPADKLMLDEPWDYNRLPEAAQDRIIQWMSANMH